MLPLQAYSSHYQIERNNHLQPFLPIIKVPFPPSVNPPSVNPEYSILKSRKARSELPTKPPNAFIIYRMQYVKELHAKSNHNRCTALANAQDDETNLIQMERSPPSYSLQYNRRIIHKRRDQRKLRHKFTNRNIFQITQLPIQFTNNQSINQFFNGLPF